MRSWARWERGSRAEKDGVRRKEESVCACWEERDSRLCESWRAERGVLGLERRDLRCWE